MESRDSFIYTNIFIECDQPVFHFQIHLAQCVASVLYRFPLRIDFIYQTTNQTINQSNNQSIKRSTNKPIYQSIILNDQ